MNIALTQDQLQFIFNTVVKPLHQLGAKVFVFGSRATQTNRKYSDLDILIEPRSSTDSEVKSVISRINEELVESSFPYKVDLVLEDEVAESYRENILKQKVELS